VQDGESQSQKSSRRPNDQQLFTLDPQRPRLAVVDEGDVERQVLEKPSIRKSGSSIEEIAKDELPRSTSTIEPSISSLENLVANPPP
jgi:hypothetical protein